jgi:chemotaxis protein methyltransferase CheR
MSDGPFDLILYRNLVSTYFDSALQRRIAGKLRERLRPGGFLVVGSHETLPGDHGGFALIAALPGPYQRAG